MDKTLTPYNISAEITISQSILDELFETPDATQVYPLPPPAGSSINSAAGTTETAETEAVDESDEAVSRIIEMAPVDYKGQPLIKRKKQPAPPVPDLRIRLDNGPASMTIGSEEGAAEWPLATDSPIGSIQVLTHDTLLGGRSSKQLGNYMEFAERASTYPVVLAIAGSQMMVAHSSFQVVEKTTTRTVMTDGSQTQRTDRDWGFRTAMLRVDLARMTDEPVDSYRIMLTRIRTDKKVVFASDGAAAGGTPYEIWMLPVTDDGTFDPSRFGYKMMLGSEVTNTVGSRNVEQIRTSSSVGLVTRVKLEGTTPARKTPPEGVATVKVVPGSNEDPLLKRARGTGEPTPWGLSLSGGGGYGGAFLEGDHGPLGVGSAAAWYGRFQGTFELNPRYALGAGLFRMGAARDTNYFALGLTYGSFNEAVGAGPLFSWSRYRRFQGLKMVGDTNIGVLLSEQTTLLLQQSYAFRVSAGNGFFVLPGFFVNLNVVTSSGSSDSLLDAQLGLRLKLVKNGNSRK